MSRSVKNACSTGASAVMTHLSRVRARAATSCISSGTADKYQYVFFRLNMPEVGGQHWQQGRDVRALAVPVDEGVHGKAVSQAMNARVDGVGANSRSAR